jgi:subtilisin-like proprotein convertase family protein
MTARLARAGISVVAVFAVLALAGSPALAKTKTKTKTVTECVDANAGIPNPGTSSAVLNVPVPKNGKKPQNGTVTAVNSVGTRITHTDDGELDLTLVSPGGTAIALASEDDGSGQGAGYGSGAAGCGGSLATFSDTFATSIATPGNADGQPIVGQFRPRQPLAVFNGGRARGPWVLLVSDCCSGSDSGVLNAFSVNVTYTYKVPAKKKRRK